MKRQRLGWPCRAGISLVEVIVAVAIIVVLLAIAFPAIQALRESARRTQCLNNQRQIILACQNFETATMMLPRGVYVPNGMASAKPVEMFTWMVDVEAFISPSIAEVIQHGEQDVLADIVNLQGQKALDVLQSQQPWARCPADSDAPKFNQHRESLLDFGDLVTSHYVAANNVGICHALRDGKTRLAPNGAFNGIEPENEASVEDGTSNTVYISERIYGGFGPEDPPAAAGLLYACRGVGSPADPSRPGFQDASFGASGGLNRFDFETYPTLAQHGVSSGHVGGVIVAMGDGSTKFLNSNIESYYHTTESISRVDKSEYQVWEQLIDINDGTPVGEF